MELDKGFLLTALAEVNNDGPEDELPELTEHETSPVNLSDLL